MLSFHALRALLILPCLLTYGCSTPISPYSPLEDLEDEDEAEDESDEEPLRDSGVRDAGVRDAGRVQDAGGPDAGVRDAGLEYSGCRGFRVVDAFGSLLADDCSSRRAEPCSDSLQSLQATIDQRLARALSRCGAPAKAGFAVTFSGLGCPTFYGYAGDLRGRVSQCVQAELESWRFACMPPCAVVGL